MAYLVEGLIAGVPLLAFVSVCTALYRRLFVPARPDFLDDFAFTPWEFQADYEEVDLTTADGVAFGAWFFRQTGSRQVIVVSPGHKGRRQDVLGIAVALWRKGFNVLCYSSRGMPGSDRVTITMGVREVQELAAAIAFARRRVREARIGLLGYSMGAVVSLMGAAGDPRSRRSSSTAPTATSARSSGRTFAAMRCCRAGPSWPRSPCGCVRGTASAWPTRARSPC
jgi:dipeptidyl aminopeptidase/acylaminoacyl peptidase